jgi:hypothetical protein
VLLYLNADNSFLDTTTVSYVQTVGSLPIWEAGLSLTIQPSGVTSSYSTFHYNVKVEDPGRDFRPLSPADLEDRLGFRKRERARPLEITSQRRLIYRYERDLREDAESRGEGGPLRGPKPSLPLEAVSEGILDGNHYIVIEILFTTDPGRNFMNWRAFIEERTGSVLYLRALVSCVLGNVFQIDPVVSENSIVARQDSGHLWLL